MSDPDVRAFHLRAELADAEDGVVPMAPGEVAELRRELALRDLEAVVGVVRERCGQAIEAGVDGELVVATILRVLDIEIPRPVMLMMKGLAAMQSARHASPSGAADADHERGA